jgi:hypothetical protein
MTLSEHNAQVETLRFVGRFAMDQTTAGAVITLQRAWCSQSLILRSNVEPPAAATTSMPAGRGSASPRKRSPARLAATVPRVRP